MNYLTSYYKHLSEQLQAKINLLEAKLYSTGELARQIGMPDPYRSISQQKERHHKRSRLSNEIQKLEYSPNTSPELLQSLEKVAMDLGNVNLGPNTPKLAFNPKNKRAARGTHSSSQDLRNLIKAVMLGTPQNLEPNDTDQDGVNDSLEEGVKKALRSGDKEKIAKEVIKQKLRGKKSNKEFHETKKELRDAKSELKFKEETKRLHSNSSLSRTKKEVKNLEKKLSELGEPRANFKKNIKKLEAEAEKE